MKKKERKRPHRKISFFNFIFLLFSISFIIFALLISGYYYHMENMRIKERIKQMQIDYEKKQRLLIKTEIEDMVHMMQREYEEFASSIKDKLREELSEGLAFIRFVDTLNLSRREKIEGIKRQLRFLSFYNGTIFYFLVSGNHELLLYPQNHTFEKHKLSSLDLPFIKNALNAKEKDIYVYTESSINGEKETKFVCVDYYKPLDLYVGTFVNFTIVEGRLKKKFLKKIGTIRYGEKKNGYFFVLDYRGNMLASGFNKELVGKNVIDLTDKNGVKLVKEFIKIVRTKGEGFVRYVWKRPSTGKFSPKITYVKGINRWKWIIGTGLYLDDIKEYIYASEKQMREDMMTVLEKVFLITIFVAFIFIFIFLILRNFIKKDMASFINFFRESLTSHKKIDTEKIVYREFYELALYANEMLDERIKIEEELMRREEFYSALVEDLPVMVIRFKEECIFTFANKRYLEYFKLKLEDIIGKTFLPYISPEDREKVVNGIKGITPQNPMFIVQHRTKGPTGEERWMEWINRGIFDENDRIIEYSAVGRDITEEKRREEENFRLQKLESLSFLAGGIAHDFNNLLTGILGNIELASFMGKGNERLEKKLKEAEAAVLRARELAIKLLTFSKGAEPVKEVISLPDFIREEALFSLHGSKVVPEFDIPQDLWPINADRSQIGQVIQNLIINALQAMPSGGRLWIGAENVIISENTDIPLSPGKYVKIRIKDTGEGIPKEYLDHIFDPYFTTKERGSGLGLAIVHSIIQRHGGYISVISQEGKGTEFIIYLPAVEKIPSSVKKGEEVEKEEISKGGGRILIMDDDEFVASALSDMLELLGYEVKIAREGQEAIDMYKKAMEEGKPFDLVIMDLTIKGGMGGKEASSKLLSIDPDAKIVVSSGYSEDPIMGKYREFGFKGVLKKPYTLQTLTKLLKSILE